ncbi:hypothetical protein BC827DRAFT_1159046 [Russula dissimulans]|nr:hypothetical protein BC827DRAFT_1159046 [Russula dissimulans]
MRTSALTVLFLAFFALFAPVAYAAPVPPESVASKRQECYNGDCRFSTVTNPSNSSSSSSSPPDGTQIISNIVIALLQLMPYINTQPGSAAPASDYSSSTNATTSSTAVATPLPTGM